MLSGLFFDVLAINDNAKESYFQFTHYLYTEGWKCEEHNKEAHKNKAEDFTEEYTLDNDQWTAKLILYCGYENCKSRVFDWELTQCEEKLYCEEYSYERECYPHL